jgi:LDH2 family malate/lactate/ureidoglycolate dehydrogenase
VYTIPSQLPDGSTGSAIRYRFMPFCVDVLQAVDVPAESATMVADSLTRADACGLYSHGSVRLLPVYTRRLQAGTTRARPNMQVVRRRKSVAVLDGGLD